MAEPSIKPSAMKFIPLLTVIFAFWALPAAYSQGNLPVHKQVQLPLNHPGQPANFQQALIESNTPDLAPTYWMLDSSWYSTWIVNTSLWYLNEKNFLYYNTHGALQKNLYIILDGGTGEWNNQTQYLYTYGSSGNTVNSSAQTWYLTGGYWVTFMYYHYDNYGRMDTSYYKNFDQATNSFTSGTQSIQTYNTSNQVLQTMMQNWDTLTLGWVNSSIIKYTYLPTGQMSEQLTQNWNPSLSDWVNSQKTDYSYDASGYVIGYISFNWDLGTSQWIQSMRATYTNNSMGSPTKKLYELWDSGSSTWGNSMQDTYTYNTGNQVLEILDQLWNTASSSWKNNWKETHSYYPSGYQETMYQYYWNPINSTWIDSYYSLNDSSGYTSEYYSKSIDWVTYQYTYGYRYLYFYNSIHQTLEYQHYDLNVATNDWALGSHRLFTYDANGNNTEELDQSYNDATSSYVNEYQILHFYSFTTGIPGTKENTPACYYANPLPKGKPVQCQNLKDGKNYRITLYSLDGQMVYSSYIHEGESLVFPQTLTEGVYLLQVSGNDQVVSRGKIILTN